MNKAFDLRAFQADLTQRIQAAAGRDLAGARLGFRSGGQNWLVALEDITEVIVPPAVLGVPGAQAWFHGVVNVRGSLYGVSDFACFAALGSTPVSATRRLLLAHPRLGVNTALLVDATSGLTRLDGFEVLPETTLAFSRQRFRDGAGREHHDLDFAALARDPRFLRIETTDEYEVGHGSPSRQTG